MPDEVAAASDREPPPIYIDHACRKPRDYVKRTGNASYFLGGGTDAGRRRVLCSKGYPPSKPEPVHVQPGDEWFGPELAVRH